MPTSDIGIDLGTRNSLAYSTGKGLVLNEPSIVVYDKNTEKIRAIGEEARLMEGRITSDMEIIRPIRQGVIVDYTVSASPGSVSVFPVELQRLRKRQWRKQPIRLVPEMSIWWRNL